MPLMYTVTCGHIMDLLLLLNLKDEKEHSQKNQQKLVTVIDT